MTYPAWGDITAISIISLIFFIVLFVLIRLQKYWDSLLDSRIRNALLKRRKLSDNFRIKYGYSWDYVIVFKVYDESEYLEDDQLKYTMKFILNQLIKGGLDIKLFYSYQHKQIFCKIRVPLERLLAEADRIDYNLQLDPDILKSYCLQDRYNHDGKKLWNKLNIPDKSIQTTIPPYDYIYAKIEYDSKSNQVSLYHDSKPIYTLKKISVYSDILDEPSLYDLSNDSSPTDRLKRNSIQCKPKEQESLLSSVDRLKLIYSIITCGTADGCHLDIHKLLKQKCILAYFPLHDVVQLSELQKLWLVLFEFPWKLKVNEIKDYFGEKIGLYFVWLGYYTTALIPAAFLGFLTWVWIATQNNDPNAPAIPYFAGFIALWSALFLEFWKRNEKYYAMKWGMVGFEETEQTRPQFFGSPSRSPVNGRHYLYFSKVERLLRSIKSILIILGISLVVIATVAAIFAIRLVMNQSDTVIAGQNSGNVVSSILIALQIQLLNSLYGDFALSLNEHENHRTDTDFEDALIAKTFIFQFINSFSSLFYIAFVKPYILDIDPCFNDNCMEELQVTLGTIFLTRIVVGNFFEVGLPLIMYFYSFYKLEKSIESNSNDSNAINIAKDSSEVEKSFLLPTYDVMLGTFEDYAELVIQFGYTTMFVAAFPLATVMSLVNNYVELKVDGWKISSLVRRPEPRSCEDIGTWYTILEIVSAAAVFVNSGIVAFTSSITLNYTYVERIWIFILMATGLFCIRLIVAFIIPDIPPEVEIQIKRQEYIVGKVLYNKEDEEDHIGHSFNLVPDYSVKETDEDAL